MEDFSVIDFVDKMVSDAISERASDIHIESHKNLLVIRFRVDGMLLDRFSLESSISEQIISRIKIISHIDIAKKRVPQDGKFSIVYQHRDIDFRVSTFPAVFGEKVVIRILDKESKIISLEHLGLEQDLLEKIKKIIHKPNGLILVTGPTGSGKTTTLYAIISMLNSRERNIVTLEDPIEYFIDGITQAQINNESGFTFARGIRAMLRQDPDTIMIGEIRDRESAKIAIEASLTGHLVFSTLHTNDAPSAIIRLLDMKIEPYLINSSVLAVLAQRLVRQICADCKASDKSVNNYQDILLFKGTGCKSCNFHGNSKRLGFFEYLEFDEKLRASLITKVSYEELRDLALKNGMRTLYQDGLLKLRSGVVSLDEFLKVVG